MIAALLAATLAFHCDSTEFSHDLTHWVIPRPWIEKGPYEFSRTYRTWRHGRRNCAANPAMPDSVTFSRIMYHYLDRSGARTFTLTDSEVVWFRRIIWEEAQ